MEKRINLGGEKKLSNNLLIFKSELKKLRAYKQGSVNCNSSFFLSFVFLPPPSEFPLNIYLEFFFF